MSSKSPQFFISMQNRNALVSVRVSLTGDDTICNERQGISNLIKSILVTTQNMSLKHTWKVVMHSQLRPQSSFAYCVKIVFLDALASIFT